MAVSFRLPLPLRGAPARLTAVTLVAGAFGWALWPASQQPAAPPSLALAGKHVDRLAFAGDESEIPVREARIYDTIAMFGRPHAEPRAWSQAPIPATVQEAGIKPAPLRPTAMPRLATAEPPRKPQEIARIQEAPKPQRVAMAAPIRPVSLAGAAPESVRVFGWDVPGSQHLPTRRDASRALDKIGSGASAVGTGTVRAVSRTAVALGDGVASAGSAIADTLGLN